jgi:hypothetical protein
VLLADGRSRRIADLRVGDAIVGTQVIDGRRRYMRTSVLAHWSTTRPAHRVRLADGTELVAGGEHRFLTTAGWRHVTGGWCRSGRRPRVRPGDVLLGPGRPGPAARPAGVTPGYRRGYLCGVVRGDSPTAADFPSERLGLEALARAHHYLAAEPSAHRPVPVLAAAREPGRIPPPVRAVRRVSVADVVDWSAEPGRDWCAGFLAGLVDACGEVVNGQFAIAHTDEAVVGRLAGALHRLGFRFTVARSVTGGPVVRWCGGSTEFLRFLDVVDPAVGDRRDLAGTPVGVGPGSVVTSIRPVGTQRLYDITTGTGDFVAAGVVSHNCRPRNS